MTAPTSVLTLSLGLTLGLFALASCGDREPDSPSNANGGDGGSGGSSGGSGGAGGDSTCGDGAEDFAVTARPSTNYTFASTLTFNVTPVKPSSELTFDWSGVTADISSHAVDPVDDIDMVTLLVWNLTEAELSEKMNDDALDQKDMEAIVALKTHDMRTSGSLFDFTSFDDPVKPETLLKYLDVETFPPDEHSYTIMAVTGTTAGEGTRMLTSFRLDPESTNTDVVVDVNSTKLDFTVDLTSMEATQVPAETGAISLDWADLTVNAMGNTFIPEYITDVMVGKYSLSRSELADQFLDLELIADELFRASVPSGTSVSLSALENAEGEAFSGIDAEHTWVAALFCGSCNNPAPWYLALLKPCPALSASP